MVGNDEFGTIFDATVKDISKIEKFIHDEVVWMNDEIYSNIKSELSVLPEVGVISDINWSRFLMSQIRRQVSYLWQQELLTSSPTALLYPDLSDILIAEDLGLLGLDIDSINADTLKSRYRQTRLYHWLIVTLERGPMSFGALSAALHNSILNHPKPYRVEVKDYVKSIFSWATFIDDEFEVNRPNYSQVISLNQCLSRPATEI